MPGTALRKLIESLTDIGANSRDGYERIVEVRLSRDAVLHNLAIFQAQCPGAGVAPVLKSNAYGHGLVPIARCLEGFDLPFVVVDAYFEALLLRKAGFRSPIVVLGFTATSNLLHRRLGGTAFGVFGLDQLRELSARLKRPLRVHLKVDTGMHRQGFAPDDLSEAFSLILANPNLRLDGFCSHLADADGADPGYTLSQIGWWNELVGRVRTEHPEIRYFHLAASSGTYFHDRIDANVIRLGIGLYGINNQPRRRLALRPVMEIRTRLAGVKWLEAGDGVGYNTTFFAGERMPMGVVPTGYASCVDRRRSNNGVFLVNGRPCPIVGRVSMNITTIDLRPAWPVTEGAEVIVLSADPEADNSAVHIAEQTGTIPYEVFTRVSGSLRRVVV